MKSNAEPKNNHDVEKETPRLSIFSVPGEYSVLLPQYSTLTYAEMYRGHNYCLFNFDEVTPYMEYVILYKF